MILNIFKLRIHVKIYILGWNLIWRQFRNITVLHDADQTNQSVRRVPGSHREGVWVNITWDIWQNTSFTAHAQHQYPEGKITTCQVERVNECMLGGYSGNHFIGFSYRLMTRTHRWKCGNDDNPQFHKSSDWCSYSRRGDEASLEKCCVSLPVPAECLLGDRKEWRSVWQKHTCVPVCSHAPGSKTQRVEQTRPMWKRHRSNHKGWLSVGKKVDLQNFSSLIHDSYFWCLLFFAADGVRSPRWHSWLFNSTHNDNGTLCDVTRKKQVLQSHKNSKMNRKVPLSAKIKYTTGSGGMIFRSKIHSIQFPFLFPGRCFPFQWRGNVAINPIYRPLRPRSNQYWSWLKVN